MNLGKPSFWSSLLAAAACLVIAGCSGASSGIGNSSDGGTDGGNTNQNCNTVPCGTGQSYQVCTSAPSGGCETVTYTVGSQMFSCSSCTGCSMAAEQAAQACLNQPGGDGGVDGGTQVCSSPMPCGTNGRTYEECTTTNAQGTCLSIDYKTSDNHDFSCPGCQNCASVATSLESYCASTTTTTNCSTAVSCGSTGFTYEECTTTGAGGVCEGISYNLSNGTNYACASCSDCTGALQSLDNFCASGGTTTNCTSWAACESSSLTYEQCTVSTGGNCTSVYYETSDNEMFECVSCGNCSAALSSMESYCNSMTTPVTTCGSPSACGSTGVTYELCTTTTGGTCTSEYYSTSDNNTFNCTGCDCTSASQSLSSYCASLTGTTCGGTTCGAGDICCTCSGTMECLSTNGGVDNCASYGCQ